MVLREHVLLLTTVGAFFDEDVEPRNGGPYS